VSPTADRIAPPRWCARLTSELDEADARASTLVRGLSIAQLNWKPTPKAWSVGQCLEHLCLSNEVYVAPIEASLGKAPAGPVDEITPGWFGRWFIRRYIEPTTQRKPAQAPRKSVPVASHLEASILDRFVASNARIRDVISRAQGHDVNRVRFTNPYVPLIRFTVGTGLQIIARHNHRHLLQAERVTQRPEFPGDQAV
jgi:DinB family protein